MMKPGQTAQTEPKAEPASATAVRVLRIEGAAVLQMAEALPEDFDAAVDAILATKGRVILGGIGK
jgi:arabinose-5-phosphate isomerase